MNCEQQHRSAVDELLQEDSPEGYYQTLSTFYESYVQSPHCDGTTGEQRAQVLAHFKSLRKFLFRLNREKKNKMHKKKNVWIG